MTAGDFLAELSGRGVLLKVTPEGNLRCKGKLDTKDVARLRAHKQELLQLISSAPPEKTPSPPSPDDKNTCNTAHYVGDGDGDETKPTPSPNKNAVPRFLQRKLEEAAELGLVACWSREFGYVSIHDPTTGEWYDLPTKDAPGWAKWEAGKRKELRKRGHTRLITRSEMEKVWHEEREDPEEELPEGRKRGLVYED